MPEGIVWYQSASDGTGDKAQGQGRDETANVHRDLPSPGPGPILAVGPACGMGLSLYATLISPRYKGAQICRHPFVIRLGSRSTELPAGMGQQSARPRDQASWHCL